MRLWHYILRSQRIDQANLGSRTRLTHILGVPFLDAGVDTALEMLRDGGLMLVPSAPVLATLPNDRAYRDAVAECDFAIIDSAYLAVLWFLATGARLHRVSGLKFIRAFVHEQAARVPGALFLVNPTDEHARANVALLRKAGFDVTDSDCYTAPLYSRNDIRDSRLLETLEAKRPMYVLLNLGGGVQEPLGMYLKQNLSFLPAIICTGAAIAFLTGKQARIPSWVDAAGLGWLARCVHNPKLFVRRYWQSLRLAPLVFRYGQMLPPADGSESTLRAHRQ